ncbi:MAG: hypothetical protein JW745_06035 [Sedimentisphaerales bacterium]|nr:hypothetical protein [Sedimentisphaerales bacterium]MBN2841753.1 hypothetical protein [Sedimentisphaerales bacterium]
MLRFNISRRFRVSTGNNIRPDRSECPARGSIQEIQSLTAMDDAVLSYLAESIVRELADRGILSQQFREELYEQPESFVESDIPAVSVGPSGICGSYQSEMW